MPDSAPSSALSGKLAVVTGASSGLGKEIARGLALQGATLIMACRNLAKAGPVREELAQSTGNPSISLMELDLASLRSVRAFAAALAAAQTKLDILVNNAGGWSMARELSRDGIELTFATNVLGPELLTRLLLPLLKAAPQGRIVNIASTVASGLDIDDLQFEKRKFAPMTVYSATKQANRMLSWALAEELKGSPATVNAMSPGLVKTDLNRGVSGGLKVMFSILVPLMGKSPEKGADTAVWLASSPDLAGASGKFYEDRKARPCAFQSDLAACRGLAQACQAMAAAKA
jgi:NAD(P)-dependent dehydrogenase (short-subunit alcohol dehydrogenase family)